MTLQFEGVGFSAGPGSGGKIGTVALVAMGSQPSTPYTVGSKWFYDGKIYTATSTTTTDGGVVPSYDTAYLYNGTYYYWDGSTLQGADESNLVHISGTETITGNKTFSGSVALGDNASAQTKPTSDTSDAVATTKFVKDFAEDGEWQKPADWIDIRSGALDNSIYFLVAHSIPTESGGVYSVATYPKFRFRADVTTPENTYDVFVDGVKVATTANYQYTEIDWATLYNNGILIDGYDIASPGEGNYTTHVIRVTPSVSSDNLTKIQLNSSFNTSPQRDYGVLWVHFELDNVISISTFLGSDTYARSFICQAVTAKNDKIKYHVDSGNTGLYSVFDYCQALVKIPVLEAENNTDSGGAYVSFQNVPSKKIVVKNNAEELNIGGFLHNFKGEILDIENPIRLQSGTSSTTTASGANNLKRLPKISTKEKGEALVMSRLDNCEPFMIDESFNDIRKLLRIYGNSTYITQLKGLTVSPEAPFDGAEPQINVSYTGMDRAALVNLFKSLPYNVGYEVVGSPTIVDGIMTNISDNNGIKINKVIGSDWNTLEINVKFSVSNVGYGSYVSFFGNTNFLLFRVDNHKFAVLNRVNSSDAWQTHTIYDAVSENVFYTANLKITKATGEFVVTLFDNTQTQVTQETYTELGHIPSFEYMIVLSQLLSGGSGTIQSADISNTYIKKDNLPFFRGTAAMTKSISVVGATGTPDLTADDKAIAEDKGWSIVLA